MEQQITIFIHYESEVAPVTVSAFDTASTLASILPDDGREKHFFSGDVELPPAFTLAYLKVRNGDHIMAVGLDRRKDANLSLKPKHRSVESERARLNDQFMNHVESTTKTFRKMINRFVSRGGKSAPKDKKR